jgi:hypothetical protein
LPFGDRKRKIGKECPTRSDLSWRGKWWSLG